MELHAFDRRVPMPDAHHDVVVYGPGSHHELGRERVRGDAQRVIPRRRERRGHSRQQTLLVVAHLRGRAVNQCRGPPDGRPKCLSHGLHSQAHPEEGHLALDGETDRGHRDAGRVGVAGSGRDDDAAQMCLGVVGQGGDPGDIDGVVANDTDLGPGRLERLDQVVCK